MLITRNSRRRTEMWKRKIFPYLMLKGQSDGNITNVDFNQIYYHKTCYPSSVFVVKSYIMWTNSRVKKFMNIHLSVKKFATSRTFILLLHSCDSITWNFRNFIDFRYTLYAMFPSRSLATWGPTTVLGSNNCLSFPVTSIYIPFIECQTTRHLFLYRQHIIPVNYRQGATL